MKTLKVVLLLLWTVAFLSPFGVGATAVPEEMDKARQALAGAMSEIGLSKGDRNLLLLTNAGYGTLNRNSTEAFLDVAQQESGCSMGRRSLLAVHTSLLEPLWFSLYRKDTGKLLFIKWTGAGFDQQVIDAATTTILTPEGWNDAASGWIGSKAFSVISISLTWAVEPPWPLLLAAAFHDHFCPGVNSGYIAGQYLMENLPLGPDDQYVFVTAPGKCAADALQMMFNATAGKSSGYTMAMSDASLAKYASGGIKPSIMAMRVNRKKDTCDGLVLGFHWNKAYGDAGVKAEEMALQAGAGNPMPLMARVRMSRALAPLPKERLLGYVVEMKAFSGKAALAAKVAGGDPYAAVWHR